MKKTGSAISLEGLVKKKLEDVKPSDKIVMQSASGARQGYVYVREA